MNGNEHYKEAEKSLRFIRRTSLEAEDVLAEAAVAQVHATLALTAAMLDAAQVQGSPGHTAAELDRD